MVTAPPDTAPDTAPSLAQIAREWGRIGVTGFGGPATHIKLLRDVCVDRRRWIEQEQFEQALAAVNMLPGPASTQLSIYCAWHLRGIRGALIGGACFIVPGLAAVIALSVLFLAHSPPLWVRGAGQGAGAAVAAVAVLAGFTVAGPMWRRVHGGERARSLLYAGAGAAAAAAVGPWLVLVLLACGALELGLRAVVPWVRRSALAVQAPLAGHHALGPPLAGRRLLGPPLAGRRLLGPPLAGRGLLGSLLATATGAGGTGALAWTAFKVGALAFGGGFVIVPLMQADAVHTYHWMTHAQFLNAVALGQVTPGPVTQTVAAVGYAAHGFGGALLAALVGYLPSFSFILLGAKRFERLVADRRMGAFLAGAAPAAAGAIIGAAIPLTAALAHTWQYLVLAAAAVALIVLRRGVVQTLLAAGAVGVAVALLGGPVSR
jgi:chromate transporter